MRRAGCGAASASPAATARAVASVCSSGSSSSRISAQMRIRSARAACALRRQKVSRMPASAVSAIAMPRRVGSRPMMWRTSTSAPRSPVRRTPSLPASARPTSVLRTASMASCGRSSETCRSASSTSSAGSPSSLSRRLPSASVISRSRTPERSGWQPWVTRDTTRTPSPNTTPDRPPENTPPAAPCPRMLPLPPTANCSAPPRPDESPPKR
jgi:hypothetical protein